MDIAKTRDGRMILYATNGQIKRVGNVQLNSLKIKGSGLNSNSNNSISNAIDSVNTENVEDVSDVKYSIDDSFNDWLDDEELFFISDIE